MPVLAVAAAGLGALGVPAVFGEWSRLVGDPGAPGVSVGELALSGGLAVATAAVVAVRLRRTASKAAQPGEDARREGVAHVGAAVPLFAGWLGLENAARALVWDPMKRLADALAWFDDRVIDGAVEAVPRAGMALARIARRPFEAGMDDVVRAVAGFAGRLGRLARRPQNGQVHTYFAQAAVGLIVLAVVIALVR